MEIKFGLTDDVINQINSVFLRFPQIEKVIIYGSRAKGNYRTGSDIDLVMVFPDGTLSDQIKIENQLDDLYLPYKIDLSILDNIENPDLISHINRVGKIFFTKKF